MGLSPLYGPILGPSVPSTVLCILNGPLPPVWPYGRQSSSRPLPLTALCPFYIPLYTPLSSVPSTCLCPVHGLCHLCGFLSLLHPSVPSTASCPVYSPLSSIWSSVTSTAICALYGPLSPLRPPVPSRPPCPLYSPLSLYGPLSTPL
jgi:hypothetical protein